MKVTLRSGKDEIKGSLRLLVVGADKMELWLWDYSLVWGFQKGGITLIGTSNAKLDEPRQSPANRRRDTALLSVNQGSASKWLPRKKHERNACS